MAAFYNVNRDTKKQPKPYDWEDFFPGRRTAQRVQTETEMLLAMDAWAITTKAN